MKRSSSQGPTGLKGDNFDEDEAFDSLDEQLLDLTLSPVPNKISSRKPRKLPKMQNFIDMQDVLPLTPLEKLPTTIPTIPKTSFAPEDIIFRTNMYLETQIRQVMFEVTRYIQSAMNYEPQFDTFVESFVKKIKIEIENELKLPLLKIATCFRKVFDSSELIPFKILMASANFVDNNTSYEERTLVLQNLNKKIDQRSKIYQECCLQLQDTIKELNKQRKSFYKDLKGRIAQSKQRKEAINLLESQIIDLDHDIEMTRKKTERIKVAPTHNITMLTEHENEEFN
ncbi:hypothetical protein TVAG_158480, partial [Trichomonas vaginalis G3]